MSLDSFLHNMKWGDRSLTASYENEKQEEENVNHLGGGSVCASYPGLVERTQSNIWNSYCF